MKLKNLAIVFLTCLLVAGVARSNVPPSGATAVDLTPALKIGDYTISRYLFEKAYNQFVGAGVRRSDRSRSNEELEGWFRLYLAQQVIKGELVEKKQLDRPEVVEMTERMARYMLTQPHGPLYCELGGVDRIAFRRERRLRILKECQFTAFPENIAQLWTAITHRLSRSEMLQEADVAMMDASVLATYVFDGVAKQISAVGFVQDFRQGIARIAPRDAKSLCEQIEDIVVADYDWIEAKKRRTDQTPQFQEDRRNFALNQALALYEKEVLTPQLTISSEELEASYQAKLERFTSPIEVTGTLFIFPDADRARAELPTLAKSSREPGAVADEIIEPFIIPRTGPVASMVAPYSFLSAMPIGQSFGPFPYAGKYAVFLKRGVGGLAPKPFEQVRPEIQNQILREKIEALELEYYARHAGRVEVCVDLGSYGIQNLASQGTR